MICPECGSRDVIDSRDSKRRIITAECQHCLNEWEQGYDPFPKEIHKQEKDEDANS